MFNFRILGDRQRAIANEASQKYRFHASFRGNRNRILSIYADAIRLTRETGIQHEVDHIIPPQGIDSKGNHVVSGLHTEANLRILTQARNAYKRNYVKK